MQVGTLAPYKTNFIPYAAFMLNTKDDAKVDVENSDDIIVDFNQTISITP